MLLLSIIFNCSKAVFVFNHKLFYTYYMANHICYYNNNFFQSIYNNEGVHDIKFDPFNEYQFACASENHSVSLYDIRYPSKRTFQFSAHENRTLKCEWNPKVRNKLATSGHSNIKVCYVISTNVSFFCSV